MVRTPNSRWVKWLDTSEVEELKLPTSVTDEEMLIMFDAAGELSFDGGGGGGGGGGGSALFVRYHRVITPILHNPKYMIWMFQIHLATKFECWLQPLPPVVLLAARHLSSK